MKISIIAILITSSGVNAKELTGIVNVLSIKRESKNQYLVLFKEKPALYKSSYKYLDCLKVSIKEKKEIIIRWDINKLALTGCKSKRK